MSTPSNYYDAIAPLYDRSRWLTESVAEDVADFILDLVAATPETSFLEPGVGTGLNVLPLVKRGYPVTGIDVSQEMLDQFRQKLGRVPANLRLIHADASRLPFADASFDVVITVHMIHTVPDWRSFLDDIQRILKPGGVYLNCQWITPPARREFEDYFRAIQSAFVQPPAARSIAQFADINVEDYFNRSGIHSRYFVAKEWTVSNTVRELLSYFNARAYGLCWQVPEPEFSKLMREFEAFCLNHYGSLEKTLTSTAKFEIWAYTIGRSLT
ncbi:class I SAM-dependent methyltransferase [Leptolyngbya sp. FACHB-36]|uniref:class I SAM-dependent methyltransferase n=1 Tax=Leptolyngbya sp. FACHB-36 TaxID=2692808 RepID=UPI0016801926|nr:class I SAM-dependent methyltransferase [Leptolyngbya sp. FACHB-36]MBD2018592.1 class I SAM-dependent methyltransferase [Leptolyngbya sp. FACHB-36]